MGGGEEERAADAVGVIDIFEGEGVCAFREAVAIERLERMRSRGYVLHTLVIPANAPAVNRVGVSSVLDPLFVNSCITEHSGNARRGEVWTARTDLLELLVGGELDGAVGYDANAVYTVAAHETCKAFFAPHSGQRGCDAFVGCCAALSLDLSV